MTHAKGSSLRFRFRLVGGPVIFGPGKADLLAEIERTGSISAAGRAMGMSYRRAWTLVDEMNRGFARPLVETAVGGPSGGGARLTPSGSAALAAYRAIELRAAEMFSEDLRSFRALMAD